MSASGELLKVMQDYQLNKEHVADMLGVSVDAVRQWTAEPHRAKFRECPMIRLEQLRVILKITLPGITATERARVLEIIGHYSAASKR